MDGMIATQGHGDVCSWAAARAHAWFLYSPFLWPLVVSGTSDIKTDCGCIRAMKPGTSSLAKTLKRIGSAPHWQKHSEEGPIPYLGSIIELTLCAGQPCWQAELALRVRKWESRSHLPCVKGTIPPLVPCHLYQVGDLAKPLSSCSIQENKDIDESTSRA